MKNNNNTDNKSKALYGFIGLLVCTIILLFWPQQSGHSQPDIGSPKDVQQTVDSVSLLRNRNDRQDSINLMEAHSLVQLTNALNQKQRRKAIIKIKELDPMVLLRFNGDIFEARHVESYKGYLIVNLDSFLLSLNTETAICDADSCQYAPTPSPPAKKKSWLKRLFSHQ